MRVCIEKSTNKIIEMQSFATEGTLIQNALQYGYLESDIEEKKVSDEEYQIILEAQPKLPQPPTEIEQLRLEQAQANAEMIDLMMALIYGGM